MADGRTERASAATWCVASRAHAGWSSDPYLPVKASRRSSAPYDRMSSRAAVIHGVRGELGTACRIASRRRDNGHVRTGSANLPLHGGRAPAWLFPRMVRLSREITAHIVQEYGSDEMLRRLSDPYWFQAFGCVLGFDWHSSGVTTTVTGALKEGLKGIEHELGVYSQGGKGAASRKTPLEIRERCDRLAVDSGPLVYASRMAAKVDSAAVQDGYQLYHHAFFFSRAGHWSVV